MDTKILIYLVVKNLTKNIKSKVTEKLDTGQYQPEKYTFMLYELDDFLM